MEFYKPLQKDLDANFIQQHLRIDNLHQYCDFIDNVISSCNNKGEIYCSWGLIHRSARNYKKRHTNFITQLPKCACIYYHKRRAGRCITLHYQQR